MKYFIGYPCLMAKNEERNAAITSQKITPTTYHAPPQKVKHRFVRTPKRFVSAKYSVRILRETCKIASWSSSNIESPMLKSTSHWTALNT